jgi:N-acetylmuramoyl-L-alanine amidase
MIKKRRLKKEKTNEERLPIWYRAMRALLCVALAILACSSLSLLGIGQLKAQNTAVINSSDNEKNKMRIYIDQGHNPIPHHNIGAEGNGLYEQDVTYIIGCRLAELLVEDGRFEVCLSRPNADAVLGTDNLTSLDARVTGAEAFEADYFISLHINSYASDSANGIEVFAFTEDSRSYSFGSFLLEGMVDSTNLKRRGMKESSELYVLKNSKMPAVLLEMGFISNPDDAALLAESPELFAQGIYNGILDYLDSAYDSDLNILLWAVGASAVTVAASAIALVISKRRRKRKAA